MEPSVALPPPPHTLHSPCEQRFLLNQRVNLLVAGLLSCRNKSTKMEHVWVKGDICIAKYSGDGNWYEAKILKLYKNDRGQKVAWVSFAGYSNEENEEVRMAHLKPFPVSKKKENDTQKSPDKLRSSAAHISSEAMFSPLRGNEEKERLEEKYKVLEMEQDSDNRRWETTNRKQLGDLTWEDNKTRSSPKVNGRRKTAVATGGAEKQSSQMNSTRLQDSGVRTNRKSIRTPRYLYSFRPRGRKRIGLDGVISVSSSSALLFLWKTCSPA